MLRAPRATYAIEPRLQGPEVILDTVVARRVKSIIIIDRHLICLRPTADGPPTRAQIDLNMHHIMLLNLPRLVVFRTVKDQIARP